MAETSVGAVSLELEVEAKLEDDIKKSASEMADKIQKQVSGMNNDIFKDFRSTITQSLGKVQEAIKHSFDAIKLEMRAFLEEMSTMIKSMGNIQMPGQDGANTNPNPSIKASANAIRGPPSLSVRKPKIKFDPQFDTEMFKQKYAELEQMMDMYDKKFLSLDKQKKVLEYDLSIAWNPNEKKAYKKELESIEEEMMNLQNASKRTSITIKAMDRQMKSTSSSTTKAGSSFNILKRATSYLSSGLKKLGGSALSLAGSGMRKLGNGFKSAGEKVLQLSARLLGLKSASDKASGSMRSFSLGRLIKSFTIFSLIFPLVSRGIMALGKNLSQTLMTNQQFANSLTKIRSNLATAFTPIFNAILPAINALMSGLAKLTGYISAFVSALFGQSYAATKKATQGIYAAKDAMGVYGNSASKATKEAEKAKRSLMGFDEINKLDDPSNSSDSGGSGGAPEYMPSDVNESLVNRWVKKLKDMWSKGDYAGIGKVIGEKINDAVSSFTKWISWDRVGSGITKFLYGFTTLFNSLIDTINWDNVGKMFGTGINTIANTIFLLITGINWTKIGQAFADGLNGLVYSVDWNKLGITIGSYFQASINAIYGFVTTADWPGIGNALGSAINGLVNYVNFPQLMSTIAIGLSGVISSIHEFIKTTDWKSIGNEFAEGINSLFRDFDWKNFATTTSDFVKSLLSTISIAITNIEWSEIGHSIATMLINIDWLGIALDLGDVLVRAIIGINVMLYEAAQELAGNVWKGFSNGVIAFFKSPGEFIRKNIVDPFVNWFKSLFGIHSPSTVMHELGQYVMQGLINGLKSVPIVGSIAGLVGDGLSWIKGKYNDFKTKGKELFDNVKKGISGNPIVSTVETTVKNGVDSIKNKYNDIKTKGKDLMNYLKNGVSGNKKTVYDQITSVASNIASKIKSGAVNKASSWGSDMMSGLASGIRGATSWVRNAVSNVADTISSWLHFSRPDVGPLHYYEEWMPDMMQGLASTLESSTPNLIRRVSALASNMASAMQTSLSEPTIAFAGERQLNVAHELTDSRKSKETSLQDVVIAIREMKDEISGVKKSIEDKDMDVHIDRKALKDTVVDEVNKDTRRNGKCPIDV